jgi:4-diphosphocytidyl-2-C-methyl-D-erythritol kinase
MLTVHASAKINLTLEVLGKRADGYHEIATVFQEIDLTDTLYFEEHQKLVLECDLPALQSDDNMVLKAARLLQNETGSQRGALISIRKGIPVASGLGGGSSDAAATLLALNELWGLGLSLEQLLPMAAGLGSDTAFFLYGGTALGEGRGERITPLPPYPTSKMVLFRPPVVMPPEKTKRLYNSLDIDHFGEGHSAKELVDMLNRGGKTSPSFFVNTFEKVAFTTYDGLEDYWQRFHELGADNIHLAGSGPTLFTMVRDNVQEEAIHRNLTKEGFEAYLVQTVAQH